ncbi:MAG: hypothetical protein GY787_29430 [Alteromonadales bacterium]|nr:hypothetical protein [Alteromonadales bacterium]
MSSTINSIQDQNLQLSAATEQQATVSIEINNSIDTIKSVSETANESSKQLLSMAEEINQAVNAINLQLQKFTKG